MRRVSALLLLILVFIPMKSVKSQIAKDGVNITFLGDPITGTDVNFAGVAENNLPWDVRDVKITVFLRDDISFSTQIKSINTGEAKSFIIQGKYFEGVDVLIDDAWFTVDYVLKTDDVSKLLDYYWNSTEDIRLRLVIPKAFSTMTSSASTELIECISVAERSDGPPDIKTTLTDLLCLEGIRAIGGKSEAKAALELLAWYEDHEALDLSNIYSILSKEANIVLDVYPILYDLKAEDVTMPAVIRQTLEGMTGDVIPVLVDVEAFDSSEVQDVADELLGGSNIPHLLFELCDRNFDDFVEVIGFWQENGNVEYTTSLLETLVLAENKQAKNIIEKCILSFSDSSVPYLVEALHYPELDVVNLAEEILYKLGEEIQPDLAQQIEEREITTGSKQSAVYIEALRKNADDIILAELEEVYSAGETVYKRDGCVAAVKKFETMFTIRNPLPVYREEVGLAYACAANMVIQKQETYLAQEYFFKSLMLAPENQSIRQEAIMFFLSQNKTYLFFGIVMLFILFAVSISSTNSL